MLELLCLQWNIILLCMGGEAGTGDRKDHEGTARQSAQGPPTVQFLRRSLWGDAPELNGIARPPDPYVMGSPYDDGGGWATTTCEGLVGVGEA